VFGQFARPTREWRPSTAISHGVMRKLPHDASHQDSLLISATLACRPAAPRSVYLEGDGDRPQVFAGAGAARDGAVAGSVVERFGHRTRIREERTCQGVWDSHT
jgi:hypothetical protein